jgi:nitrilase
MTDNKICIALAQMAPLWLDREKTTQKIIDSIDRAGEKKCRLIVFGETLLPGYPVWLTRTDGAKFNSIIQKEIFLRYFRESVSINNGDLNEICKAAARNTISIYLGIVERAEDRGGHSLYCSLAFIDNNGNIKSVHRKLVPTYEERLVWANGDGNGLQVHKLKTFNVGGLNCWENWMPLAKSALYAQGENLHIAVWPGSKLLTMDITRFIALESRSFVVSVSGLLRKSDIPEDIPHYELITKDCEDTIYDGGSCVAAPDGKWILEPQTNVESLFFVEIDHDKVIQERQNLDLSGHYSRPDITQLLVNRDRQNISMNI